MDETECHLVDLFNRETFSRLQPPEEGESYAVFRIRGFSESGLHAFLRVVPALGLGMAKSHIPLAQAERFGELVQDVVGLLADGRLDTNDLLSLAVLARRLFSQNATSE